MTLHYRQSGNCTRSPGSDDTLANLMSANRAATGGGDSTGLYSESHPYRRHSAAQVAECTVARDCFAVITSSVSSTGLLRMEPPVEVAPPGRDLLLDRAAYRLPARFSTYGCSHRAKQRGRRGTLRGKCGRCRWYHHRHPLNTRHRGRSARKGRHQMMKTSPFHRRGCYPSVGQSSISATRFSWRFK